MMHVHTQHIKVNGGGFGWIYLLLFLDCMVFINIILWNNRMWYSYLKFWSCMYSFIPRYIFFVNWLIFLCCQVSRTGGLWNQLEGTSQNFSCQPNFSDDELAQKFKHEITVNTHLNAATTKMVCWISDTSNKLNIYYLPLQKFNPYI